MSAGSQSQLSGSRPRTSTPTSRARSNSDVNHLSDLSSSGGRHPTPPLDDASSHAGSGDGVIQPGHLEVPILGYEVMEERGKFTVFKLQVLRGVCESWFIFRRYSDFARLNEKLSQLFPHFRLSLPPKKWLGDNFDSLFLGDRVLGLQAYLNNIISHREVCNSQPVQEFLCMSKPPGPHDSLEESRAWCEHLAGQVYQMKQLLQDKDNLLALLRDECSIYRVEVSNLRRALQLERRLPLTSPVSSNPSESSLTEQEQAEADCDRRLPGIHQAEKSAGTDTSSVKDTKCMTTLLKVDIPSDDMTRMKASVSAT